MSFALSFPFFFLLSALTPLVASVAEVSLPGLTLHSQATSFSTFDLANDLTPAKSTLSSLAVVPAACADYQGPSSECTTGNMSATAVTFEDCGSAFTVCRCSDADMSMTDGIDRLARVPVGLRRFVGSVMLMNGHGQTDAYTNLSTGDIHMFGVTQMDTWVHEATHSFDYAVPSAAQSNSAAWESALTDDSCASDDYSLTNRAEDFAQLSVLKVYMLLHSGVLPQPFKSACMENQLAFISSLPVYSDTTSLFGNTCEIPDGAQGVRHSTPPAVLDESRVFRTVAFDAPLPSKTSSSASKISTGMHGLGLVLVSTAIAVFSGWSLGM
ncbi:hypothetical protein FB45DRAFT_801789 [Roridomyces roridus]|uniref:Uncharacterized protein n=1 Tax=Roridomyces roridus TaxID=1738132 RepID=A0AAD7BA39_9AGAR|nr:hypothetical protein FB45DRAFT_801789 [Roridomyces roridus]